jgi:phosphate starvation-inducible PhoH-like protein
MTRTVRSSRPPKKKAITNNNGRLHIDFLNSVQKLAYTEYQSHDITFLLGPAGTAKTFLASAFAIKEVLDKTKKRIILTRPIVEAGEKLGFLPGTFEEKIDPYVRPVYDCMTKLMGGMLKDEFDGFVERYIELSPIAFMRGRSFEDSVCIFDEAQNATASQILLFLTRFGKNSKLVITGDPTQSDLFEEGQIPLMDIVKKIESIPRITVINFRNEEIVRHPLISEILKKIKG